MKAKHIAVSLFLLLTLAFVPAEAKQQGDIVSGVKKVNLYFKERPTQKHAILSTGECAAGIAFSSNPVGAATVGLPVLALGNGLSYFLRNVRPVPYLPNQDVVSIVRNSGRYVRNHPTLIQDASGSFCLAYGLTRSGRTPKVKVKNPGSNGGGDGGNGGNGSGGGNGGSGGGNGGGGNGGGNGGSGGGNGGNGGGSGGGNGGCQQDCGLPGNGGVNGGHDGNKPPFPGNPHRPIPE